MKVWPRKTVGLHLAAAVGLAVCAVIVVLAKGWPWYGAFAGPAVGAIYFLAAMRKYLRRRRLSQTPLPEEWHAALNKCVPFYRRLDAEGRNRFENDVRFFLAEQHIYGPQGTPVPDRVKVLVAASAAMLGHGMPEWEWPTVRDIVIYPTAFDEEYEVDRSHSIAGMVHAQGPVIFSERHLKHGFRRSHDGFNVGLHELAHVMDMADGAADGVPAGMEWMATAPWINLMVERLREKHGERCRKVLGSYACTNEAEFFAVAVEVFFEKPKELKRKDPELFDMLSRYFNMDPQTGKPLSEV
jgi:Mlc titration factor MtfA (ptsG expression regulator)